MTNLRINTSGVRLVSKIGKALDHPLRVRAIAALRDGELCVCELIGLFGLAPSTVSRHLAIVAEAGLVDRRRAGKWIHYSLPRDPEPPIAKALAMVLELVEGDPVVAADRTNVPTLSCDPEE